MKLAFLIPSAATGAATLWPKEMMLHKVICGRLPIFVGIYKDLHVMNWYKSYFY
tara:strand:- start:73 stop:234 length:162 start_codon:yes stop_codon:yes gene_type:complete